MSPGARETPSRNGPRFGDRKGSRASVSQGEGGIKNPRAKALWDKWRHVWMMAWERDRRLKDKLQILKQKLAEDENTLSDIKSGNLK